MNFFSIFPKVALLQSTQLIHVIWQLTDEMVLFCSLMNIECYLTKKCIDDIYAVLPMQETKYIFTNRKIKKHLQCLKRHVTTHLLKKFGSLPQAWERLRCHVHTMFWRWRMVGQFYDLQQLGKVPHYNIYLVCHFSCLEVGSQKFEHVCNTSKLGDII